MYSIRETQSIRRKQPSLGLVTLIGVLTILPGSVALSPAQDLTPAPYAIHAPNARTLSGTIFGSAISSVGNANGGSAKFFLGSAGNPTTSGSLNTAICVSSLT